jgi:23S rRNA maturation mini-RNase III
VICVQDGEVENEVVAVVSYLLTEVELESALRRDYESVSVATRGQSRELTAILASFEEEETEALKKKEGGAFKKHRDNIDRYDRSLKIK